MSILSLDATNGVTMTAPLRNPEDRGAAPSKKRRAPNLEGAPETGERRPPALGVALMFIFVFWGAVIAAFLLWPKGH